MKLKFEQMTKAERLIWTLTLPHLSGNKNGSLCLMTTGSLLTHDEAEEVIHKLRQFYDQVTPQDIESYNASRTQNTEPPIPGFVYLVSGRGGDYKIGRSGDVETRIYQLSNQWKTNIELICCFYSEDSAGDETTLHNHFSDKSLGQEWFALTDEDIEFVKSISRRYADASTK